MKPLLVVKFIIDGYQKIKLRLLNLPPSNHKQKCSVIKKDRPKAIPKNTMKSAKYICLFIIGFTIVCLPHQLDDRDQFFAGGVT